MILNSNLHDIVNNTISNTIQSSLNISNESNEKQTTKIVPTEIIPQQINKFENINSNTKHEIVENITPERPLTPTNELRTPISDESTNNENISMTTMDKNNNTTETIKKYSSSYVSPKYQDPNEDMYSQYPLYKGF